MASFIHQIITTPFKSYIVHLPSFPGRPLDSIDIPKGAVTYIIIAPVFVFSVVPFRILYMIQCVKSSSHGSGAGLAAHLWLYATIIRVITSHQGQRHISILNHFRKAVQGQIIIIRDITPLLDSIVLSKNSIKDESLSESKHVYSILTGSCLTCNTVCPSTSLCHDLLHWNRSKKSNIYI